MTVLCNAHPERITEEFRRKIEGEWTISKWKKRKADSQSKNWLVRLSLTQQELEHHDAKRINFSS